MADLFRRGDKVRVRNVVAAQAIQEASPMSWNEGMEEFCGKENKVAIVLNMKEGQSVILEDGPFSWEPEALELIEKGPGLKLDHVVITDSTGKVVLDEYAQHLLLLASSDDDTRGVHQFRHGCHGNHIHMVKSYMKAENMEADPMAALRDLLGMSRG